MPYHDRLSPFAVDAFASRGRLYTEKSSDLRSPLQRDRDRIIHCTAFRRLKHKTQVFVAPEGDHVRTRLTHTLEVAQIARTMARALRLDEDLAESCALAHDMGHTPFGHAGEDALNPLMQSYGGFSHNDQTLRVLTVLERRYPEFDGLNLCWETLEGIVKHNGPVSEAKMGFTMRWNEAIFPLELNGFASLEAQIAALADDIAYNNHDLEDGLRAGFFSLENLESVPLWANTLAAVRLEYPNLDAIRTGHELIRRLIGMMVRDVLTETEARLARSGVETVDDVRMATQAMVDFSPDMQQNLAQIRVFLLKNMYEHWHVNRERLKGQRILTDLFSIFMENNAILPPYWQEHCRKNEIHGVARAICDYIAGMTDRMAIAEHARIFDVSHDKFNGV